ncbi:MAG: hypothetical protein LBH00_10260, partial [Planctomycetaceae bacterium]|nr:hypothetical protein [Planctomycetaceae bacterium]
MYQYSFSPYGGIAAACYVSEQRLYLRCVLFLINILPIFTPFILRADLLPVFYYPFLVNIAASIALAGICTVHC